MKLKSKFIIVLLSLLINKVNSQCFIPSTAAANSTVSFSFAGGSFQSYGCAPIDPTYWLSGNGVSATIVFANPENNPSIRVWGMNDDDVASLTVNGTSYSLSAASATYDAKVVCGISPGPNGIIFSGGNITGANNNTQGNYSYQNIQLNATNVSTIVLTGLNGLGWGFAGVVINCDQVVTGVENLIKEKSTINVYPNPFTSTASIELGSNINNAELNIYNVVGEKIKTISTLTQNVIQINRENISAGIYFIQLREKDKLISIKKIIIED